MQDNFGYCRAYLVHSENEFKMLKAYILSEYSEAEDGYLEYDGNGWYVVEGEDSGYASLFKLSNIIKDWNATLNEIMKHTIEF